MIKFVLGALLGFAVGALVFAPEKFSLSLNITEDDGSVKEVNITDKVGDIADRVTTTLTTTGDTQ